MARELTVDVDQDTGLRSAGKIVGGDDLVTDRGQGPGLGVIEKTTACLVASIATYQERCTAHCAGSHELPPGKPDTVPAQSHSLQPAIRSGQGRGESTKLSESFSASLAELALARRAGSVRAPNHTRNCRIATLRALRQNSKFVDGLADFSNPTFKPKLLKTCGAHLRERGIQ
jgi:hypothetical protein